MLDCIKYVNSFGDTIEFNKLPYMLQSSDLKDYKWSYSTKNEYNPKIYSFSRNMVEKKVQIAVLASTKKKYDEYCNRLLEVFEKDIYAVKKGKLIVNDDYYMEGYFVQKQIKDWYASKVIMNEFVFVSETGKWMKDVYKVFGSSYTPILSEDNPDAHFCPNDFPFDFAPASDANKLVSDSFVPFDFEIVFHGACEDPTLIAGGRVYRVYTALEEGEYLTINSIEKTIVKTKENGEKVNEFSKRDRENYIFEKMPATDGRTLMQWQEGCIVSVRSFTERSEPKWI